MCLVASPSLLINFMWEVRRASEHCAVWSWKSVQSPANRLFLLWRWGKLTQPGKGLFARLSTCTLHGAFVRVNFITFILYFSRNIVVQCLSDMGTRLTLTALCRFLDIRLALYRQCHRCQTSYAHKRFVTDWLNSGVIEQWSRREVKMLYHRNI